MNVDVAIVGGGVSGLGTAYALKRRGYRVAVLERQAAIGGNAISERLAGGFLMEHGPSTLRASSAATVDLSGELGLGGQRCELGDGVRHRYLVADGRLHGIPVSPLGFLTSGFLSARARMRMMAEMAIPRRDGIEDESVLDFCTRRFGREVAERIIDPLVGGLYAGRASELSVASVFPALVAMERQYGSVSLGVLRRRRQGGKMPGSRLFSFRGGVAALPGALAHQLGDGVATGVTVRRIVPTGGGFHIQAGTAGSFKAKALVLATQPHVAAGLLADADPQAAAAAAEIVAPPMAVVFLGYARESVAHTLDGVGFLLPESENRPILGSQFCSTMFEARAPEGHVAIAGYFGGTRSPEVARLPASDLIALAREEFGDLVGAKGAPAVARVRHWPMGLPQYRRGHQARIAQIRGASQRQPGLFVTGNYFTGPSVSACVEVAQKAAAEVDAYLAGTRSSIRGAGGVAGRTKEARS